MELLEQYRLRSVQLEAQLLEAIEALRLVTAEAGGRLRIRSRAPARQFGTLRLEWDHRDGGEWWALAADMMPLDHTPEVTVDGIR